MRFEFLMVCRTEAANVEFIRDLLGQALRERGYDEVSDEELEEAVRISLLRPVPDSQDENGQTVNRTLCGFDLELLDETPNLQLAAEDFTTSLAETTEVEHVLKFYDDHLLNQNIEYMRELFGLEMKLRKTLSLIYLRPYCDSPYDILCDEKTEIRKNDGQKVTPELMEQHRENELFHMLFGQYGTLNKRKLPGKVEDIVGLLSQTKDFEAFQRELTRVPIEDESDSDLIVFLTERLESAEKLRNSVAHNRTPSRTVINNYQETYVKLNERLDEFLKTFEPETA